MSTPEGGQHTRDGRHDRRVAALAMEIGSQLGMGGPQLDAVGRGGLLHDIGKLGIPVAILEKAGSLTESEWRVMKTHPELGLAILGGTGRYTREMLAVLYHHERMDGSGYPHGLAAGEIPIEARIVAVADTYDVLTSDRPYRRAFTQVQALHRILQEAGPHLDPRVVDALLRVPSVNPRYLYVA
jgi:HD-GYP domain-containing protein (c-di-GMP phosphodiesterase class II)